MDILEQAKADFTVNTVNHTVKVLLDDGVNRHIVCTHGGSNNYRFDLITYAGGLLYRGDMGSYVFERVHDMFDFFRSKDGRINPMYWAEKLQAIEKNSGWKKFSREKFLKAVWQHVNNYFDGFEIPEDLKSEITDALNDVDDNEYSAGQMIHEFDHNGWTFQDFWEGGGCDEFEYRYAWACHAIVWAINQYNVLTGSPSPIKIGSVVRLKPLETRPPLVSVFDTPLAEDLGHSEAIVFSMNEFNGSISVITKDQSMIFRNTFLPSHFDYLSQASSELLTACWQFTEQVRERVYIKKTP